jgi:hypothetical protein
LNLQYGIFPPRIDRHRAKSAARRVSFIVAELGRDADPFMLHLYAALAEKERREGIGDNLNADSPLSLPTRQALSGANP